MKIAKDFFAIDLNKCILWQYNDAKNLQRILQGEYDFFDFCTNKFWQNYIDFIFNVSTATRTGLERWARLVGISSYYATETNDKPIKGKASWEVVIDGVSRDIELNYVEAHERGTKFASMTDDFLRRAIIARFFLLDSNGSCDAINRYLAIMYGHVTVNGQTYIYNTKWNQFSGTVAKYAGKPNHDAGIYYKADGKVHIYNGSAWIEVPSQNLTLHEDGKPTVPTGWYYSDGTVKVFNGSTWVLVDAESLTLKKSSSSNYLAAGWYYYDGTSIFVYDGNNWVMVVASSLTKKSSIAACSAVGHYYVSGGKTYICSDENAWVTIAASTLTNLGTVTAGCYYQNTVSDEAGGTSIFTYIYDGQSWVEIANDIVYKGTARPETGWYYTDSNGIVQVHDGEDWVSANARALTSVGGAKPTLSIPQGYCYCENGKSYLYIGAKWIEIEAAMVDKGSELPTGTPQIGWYYKNGSTTYYCVGEWVSIPAEKLVYKDIEEIDSTSGSPSNTTPAGWYYTTLDGSSMTTHVSVGSGWISIASALRDRGESEPTQHLLCGDFWTDKTEVRKEAKVYCSDVGTRDNGGNLTSRFPPYTWTFNYKTSTGKYYYDQLDSGKYVLPMEIYYFVRVGDGTYESVVNKDYYGENARAAMDRLNAAGLSDEEAYTLTLLANQRVFLPHPAGVRINGLDEDIPLPLVPVEFFNFELEETYAGLDDSADYFGNEDGQDIRIGSLDNSTFYKASDVSQG